MRWLDGITDSMDVRPLEAAPVSQTCLPTRRLHCLRKHEGTPDELAAESTQTFAAAPGGLTLRACGFWASVEGRLEPLLVVWAVGLATLLLWPWRRLALMGRALE